MNKAFDKLLSIGLIAGNGQFPVIFAKEALRRGISVVAVAHLNETDPVLEKIVKEIKWIHIGQIGKIIKFFKSHEIEKAVMAGGIVKPRLFTSVRPDIKGLKLFNRLAHLNDDNVLKAFADFLEEEGVRIIDSTIILPELLAPCGILTKRKPSVSEKADMEFGWRIAKAVGDLDIGQCIVVKERSVLAVEAVDGTDATILRGGGLCSKGAVVIKVSKPNQDLRFDVPAIGVDTIKTMQKVKAGLLVVEAGKTILFDRQATVNEADKAKIAIVSQKMETG